MQRTIVGYHEDEVGDWVAELDCHHGQHVRHQPPFSKRPWVTTAQGRAQNLGATLNCVRCDRLELPEELVSYKQTPQFSSSTIPAGLIKDHATKRGVWGRIRVVDGSLIYRLSEPIGQTLELGAGDSAAIPPEAVHAVEADGDVQFFVEFLTSRQS